MNEKQKKRDSRFKVMIELNERYRVSKQKKRMGRGINPLEKIKNKSENNRTREKRV